MTAEFMEKYRPLIMIVEMVFGANVKYHGSIETNLDAMEKSFIEKGFSVQPLTARADAFIPHMRNRFYIVCVHGEQYAFMHRGRSDAIALPVAMHNLKSLWEDRLCCIKVPSDYALCMKDFLLPSDHPYMQAHMELVEEKAKLQGNRQAPPPPKKRRRVSEPESLAEVEQDEKGARDWPNVNKAYYESIGLEYKPEHENHFRFQYTDCLWYHARPLREREIILAEDEKNPIGFLGSQEEKSLDESALVLSHRVNRKWLM